MTGDLNSIWYKISICFAEYYNENMVKFGTLGNHWKIFLLISYYKYFLKYIK